MTELFPHFGRSKRWWHWPAAIAVVELVWFSLLYPLVPRTLVGAALLGALPIPVVAYFYGAKAGIVWVAEQKWPFWTRRVLAYCISLSVGVAIFGLVVVTILVREADFEFGWFR